MFHYVIAIAIAIVDLTLVDDLVVVVVVVVVTTILLSQRDHFSRLIFRLARLASQDITSVFHSCQYFFDPLTVECIIFGTPRMMMPGRSFGFRPLLIAIAAAAAARHRRRPVVGIVVIAEYTIWRNVVVVIIIIAAVVAVAVIVVIVIIVTIIVAIPIPFPVVVSTIIAYQSRYFG